MVIAMANIDTEEEFETAPLEVFETGAMATQHEGPAVTLETPTEIAQRLFGFAGAEALAAIRADRRAIATFLRHRHGLAAEAEVELLRALDPPQ